MILNYLSEIGRYKKGRNIFVLKILRIIFVQHFFVKYLNLQNSFKSFLASTWARILTKGGEFSVFSVEIAKIQKFVP